MALVIPPTSTTDSYVQVGGNAGFISGSLVVANASVSVILLHAPPNALQLAQEDDPVTISPGTGAGVPLIGTPQDLIVGFKIKSAVAGTPAVFSGALYPFAKAGIGAGAAFTGTLSTSGGFTPSTGATTITGIIPAAGTTPTAGTGFTYTHVNGSGIYVFTFTTAFAAVPVVIPAMTNAVTKSERAVVSTGPTATGFTVSTFNDVPAAADREFSFIAVPIA